MCAIDQLSKMLLSVLVTITVCGQVTNAQDDIPIIEIPSLSVPALIAEDTMRASLGLPPRYAIAHVVDICPSDAGIWNRLNKNTLVWRLRIRCRDAVSMNLGFTTWALPSEAVLRIFDGDGQLALRPFTAADGQLHGELWTPPTSGDELIIEIEVPEWLRKQVDRSVRLGSINPGYRGFHEPPTGPTNRSLACNIDVLCQEGDDWWSEIPCVGVISVAGTMYCSGFMVNNIRQDRTPYFMTANHCGIDASDGPSIVVFWNYQNSWCRPPGGSDSGGNGDGSLDQFSTGATLRATWSQSDFTLFELDENPDPIWGVSYCGFSAEDVAPLGAVGIHHPSTEEKRISFDVDQTTIADYAGSINSHINVLDWDFGTTEVGSSGSPLFDMNHRVVGQLHGGYCAPWPCDFCSDIVSDYYGRIAVSWAGGGTPATRLHDWLDPDNTGALVVDTIPASVLLVTPTNAVVHTGPIAGPFSNDSIAMSLTNIGVLPLGWAASWVGNVPLLLNGISGQVSGNLPPGIPTQLIVSLDSTTTMLPAGVYESNLVISASDGTLLTVLHRLEIAQADIAITPEYSAVVFGQLGGPFGAGETYAIQNVGTVPTTVQVSTDAAWLDVNSTVLEVLPGATQLVTVNVGTSAANLPTGSYIGTVWFTNTNGLGGSVRHVALSVGGTMNVDNCASPQPIRSGQWLIDSTLATTGAPFNDFNACFNWDSLTVFNDIWFKVEPCEDGQLIASVCNAVNFDSRLAIYDGGTCFSPMLACNDDGYACAGYTSLVETPVIGGNVYLVRLGGFTSFSSGIGTLTISAPDDCSNPCIADATNDGTVNVSDLLVIIADWGLCVGCSGDIDQNGTVDVSDILTVISGWGPCF